MSMLLRGPLAHPANPAVGPITSLILPNPDFGNTESQDISVDFKLSMNGTRYTYVKSSDRKLLTFTWSNLGRGKLIELQEFYKLYAGDHILLTDYREEIWDAIFNTSPLDFSIDTKSSNFGGPRPESGTITLEFLGVKIA